MAVSKKGAQDQVALQPPRVKLRPMLWDLARILGNESSGWSAELAVPSIGIFDRNFAAYRGTCYGGFLRN